MAQRMKTALCALALALALLAAYVQESIKQSGVQLYTLAQLEKMAQNLTDKH